MIRKIINKVRYRRSNRGPIKIGNALNVFYKVHSQLVAGIGHAYDQQKRNADKAAALTQHNADLQKHIDTAAKAVDKLGEFLL